MLLREASPVPTCCVLGRFGTDVGVFCYGSSVLRARVAGTDAACAVLGGTTLPDQSYYMSNDEEMIKHRANEVHTALDRTLTPSVFVLSQGGVGV